MSKYCFLESRRAQLVWEIVLCIVGRFLFAVSVNVMITPLHLYSVGFSGIAQLLRSFCLSVLHFRTLPGVDLTGIIFCILNIPVLFLAWFGIGKMFFKKTLFITVISSFFMTVIPVPSAPIMDDTLTVCIIGGITAGFGAGLALRAGGSGGGQDVVGVYLAKKYPNMSVGIVSIVVSMIVYLACLIYFNVQVLIYSFIYSTITSITLDKVHYQNIKIRVEIDTSVQDMRNFLCAHLNRNVMRIDEVGDGERCYSRVVVVITKAEQRKMLRLVRSLDPDAFIVMDEHVSVVGQFSKPIE